MSTTELTEDTGEFTVSDELYEISEATNSDGTVDVEIYDFEKVTEGYDHPRVTVFFRTPTLDKKSEMMEWPRKDSPEYKFVRICEKTVGGLNAANFIKKDGAIIKADPDDWTIEADMSRRGRYLHNLKDMTIRNLMENLYLVLGFSIVLSFGLLLVGLPIVGLLALANLYPYALSLWGIPLWFGSWMGFAIGLGMIPEPDE